MSEEKKKCSRCAGTGSISCPACQGSGKEHVKIHLKEGIETKIVNCSLCHGRRKTTCGVCGGAGQK